MLSSWGSVALVAMSLLKRIVQSVKYPARMGIASDIQGGQVYVILDMDMGMYFKSLNRTRSEWVSDARNAKTYRAGMGQQLGIDLYRLRLQHYRVTTTNEEMGWR